ncbi:MAG: Major facilitator superfamily [Candidatus Moranbacteria bacterium GW2011_GWC1_45_18]|nr:MAG: Major facilitator superfamily [Candidatus Moranbacteria bacterium GW2011_GWC2_40_12]KKT33768.1 MAG: Major facilitator superfamily [Candidatus Moranbacteria bacterium GW2011_GWF2_44_10]KKT71450.1 MAG: Major facilitator superfamily [Candidatus Moranbacteria bacterium GW2011_GWF1_44_4]KKU00868.1 MAG: Major facilitator superfamily [Candidatus Moranbacteria bacterium GW2011_GWC1_45_18]OGI24000.1 MAG: hypothetical protein A2194_02830 [Candidatus Moranbacteria bacterium RIFOXYA1_FULL_44_8]OGI
MIKISKEKFIILAAVFVDIVGFGVVAPVLPFYVESFGATPKTITLLFSIFALCSFLSAPVLGALSDRFGRRPVFIASILSTSAGWFVFAGARTLPILFLGRIIDGLAAGNVSTAQSYLVDISKTDKERTANIGLIGAVIGIGFIVGPLIGGVLSSISHALPFWFTGFLALANAIVAFFFLPESNAVLRKVKISLNPFRPIVKAFQNVSLRPYFISWFLFLASMSGLQAVFALYISAEFGLGAFEAGLFLTGMGVIIAFNQAVMLRKFWLKKFEENSLILGGLLACLAGFLIVSVKLLLIFILGVVVLSFSQSLLRAVMVSRIAGEAEDGAKGEILGISSSIVSLSMISGPIVAGWAFEANITLPFFLSAGYAAVAFFFLYFVLRRNRAS